MLPIAHNFTKGGCLNMFLLDSIFKIIAKFFTVIGVASGGHVCIGFADEIEVPKEITDLYE